ncbi:hypothetical protein ASG87_12340 [Frateuria sp. Soil773]|uniref:hypothetical protein n=1 Tax=Frateuria sp. Soil773 TaxID=1736407 RepID=UPI0006F6B5C4|nr:hypothetical protein [Frateuria sp. Soil773]KRF01190.1 hypothetical protein ASG87_12340 [Frateuria sp. Soil773]
MDGKTGWSYGPRCYRVTMRVRVFATVLALLACLIAWIVLRMAGRLHMDSVQVGGMLGAALALGFALVAWTSRLRLDGTRLALRRPWGRREILMAELSGLRSRYARDGRRIPGFQPRIGRTLWLFLPYATDPAYERWLACLPDVDAADRQASMDATLSDRRLGADPVQRARRMARWEGVKRWEEISFLLLMLWTLVLPLPYAWLMLVLAAGPWLELALVRGSQGALRIDLRRNEARPLTATWLLGAPMLLGLRSAFDLDLLEPGRAVWLGALAGLPLLLAVFAMVRDRAGTAAKVFYAAMCWLYGYGVVAQGNVLLDRAASGAIPVQVVARQATHGKSTNHRLRLAGELPASHGEWFDVSASRYEASPPGTSLCVFRHPGRWGLGWLSVGDCPGKASGDL